MNTTEFKIGDIVFMKNDVKMKNPLLITEISHIEVKEYYNPITGFNEMPEYFDPYDEIGLSWLNTQKTLVKTKLRPETLIKDEQ